MDRINHPIQPPELEELFLRTNVSNGAYRGGNWALCRHSNGAKFAFLTGDSIYRMIDGNGNYHYLAERSASVAAAIVVGGGDNGLLIDYAAQHDTRAANFAATYLQATMH